MESTEFYKVMSRGRRELFRLQPCTVCGDMKECRMADVKRGKNLAHYKCAMKGHTPTNKLPAGEASRNKVYASYRKAARQRGCDFQLSRTEAHALFEIPCFYCGRPPSTTYNKSRTDLNGNYTYNGIDRLDNTDAYHVDNCVSCCQNCNYFKRDLSEDVFLQLIKAIYEYRDVASIPSQPIPYKAFSIGYKEKTDA